MEQYLQELIKENNRVIIPNFGAFIIAKEKGFSILFNNFLSFNDGLLVDFVSEKEGLNKEAALDKVMHFVGQLKRTLDSSGSYTLKGLGTFTKDANGILRFTQESELPVDNIESLTEKEMANDELLDIVSNDEAIEQELAEEIQETPLPPEKKREKKGTVTDTSKQEEPAAKKEETTNSSGHHRVRHSRKYKPFNIERSALIISLLVLLPVLLVAVYFLFFHQDTKNKEVFNKNTVVVKEIKNDSEKSKSKEPAKVTTPPTEKPVKAEKVPAEQPTKKVTPTEKKQVTTTNRKPHTVIVGSFKEERNANKMVATMKEKGYEAAFKFPRGSMFMVSAGAYDKTSQAMAVQEELLSNHKIESWILTIKE
ncbi:SPOR domain-containing protein [Marinilabiliaceae bacterium JC017]|nr:SPOR domain-containing protein [Marinilabiliaceae bacterium JC017]